MLVFIIATFEYGIAHQTMKKCAQALALALVVLVRLCRYERNFSNSSNDFYDHLDWEIGMHALSLLWLKKNSV